MDPLDIKTLLRKKGYYMSDIAKICGTSNTAVLNTIHSRPFPSPRVKSEIASILGIDERSLWPDTNTATPHGLA